MNGFRSKKQAEEGKPTRYYSNRQEQSVAKAVGGHQTKNSGATMWQKSDVSTDKWNFECKTCVKDQKQFTLKEEWFTKNKQEMVFTNKDFSAVVFSFGPNKPNYYVLDEETFREFCLRGDDL